MGALTSEKTLYTSSRNDINFRNADSKFCQKSIFVSDRLQKAINKTVFLCSKIAFYKKSYGVTIKRNIFACFGKFC